MAWLIMIQTGENGQYWIGRGKNVPASVLHIAAFAKVKKLKQLKVFWWQSFNKNNCTIHNQLKMGQ